MFKEFDEFNEGESMILKFKTSEILEKLKANKVKHVDEYVKARKVYFEELSSELQNLKKKVSKGEDVDLIIKMNKPVSYEKDYERAIQMLSMCVEETIDLDGKTFSKYILDEWDWTSNFMNNTMTYSGKFKG